MEVHEWVLFIHLAAVFAFLLTHGVQVAGMWRMRNEQDPQRSLAVLDAMPNVILVRVTIALVVITGLVAGFLEPWWQQWWMWLSLALLVAIWAAMYRWGGGYFGLIQESATRAAEELAAGQGPGPSAATLERVRTGWQPVGMTVVGLGGLAVILWLMMFKPF